MRKHSESRWWQNYTLQAQQKEISHVLHTWSCFLYYGLCYMRVYRGNTLWSLLDYTCGSHVLSSLWSGCLSLVWFPLILSVWPQYIRAHAVSVHWKVKNNPNFEARTVLTRSFYLLPSRALHQALEFLVQSLLLDITNTGNHFHGCGLRQWVLGPAMLKWLEKKKQLAARSNDGCENSGERMVLQPLHASPLRSKISLQGLEAGKEFGESCSAHFCWSNIPA